MSETTVAPTHDLPWILDRLQAAIALECSTLPLYLSAMFSLEVQSNTAYTAIRSVAMEEMVHMAIAANIVSALGGSPSIAGLQIGYPVKGLPGGVEPDLEVGLAKMSHAQLRNFRRIEMPEFLLHKSDRGEEYPTIAKFYGEIRDAIVANEAAIRAVMAAPVKANQVDDNIGFRAIKSSPTSDTFSQVLSGIDEILEQGEGSPSHSMFTGKGSEDESSHYNRFNELYYGRSYSDPVPLVPMDLENQPHFYAGRAIPFPTAVNTLAVPADGYAKVLAADPDAAAVNIDLNVFDTAFSSILGALDAVWNGDQKASWKTLGGAVHSMVDLRVLSCFNLLRHQVPPAVVKRLPEIYTAKEVAFMGEYTDLNAPVFYGPRFFNTNVK